MKVKNQGSDVQLVWNLAFNICRGELKSLARRATSGRHIEQNNARIDGRLRARGVKTKPTPIKVEYLIDPISPAVLQQASREKLAKRNKPSKLY